MEQAEVYALIKVAATVAATTATVIGVISKPLWSKLTKMETAIEAKLAAIAKDQAGAARQVGEQNERIAGIETWCKMHEDHDDERHNESMQRRSEMIGAIQGVRTDLQAAVTDLRSEIHNH